MARPQVQVSPRFPQLLPAAGGQQPGVSLQVAAPGSSLLGFGRLLGEASRVAAVYAAEEEDRELTKYRAEAAANPKLIEQLLDVAPGDQEGRARVFGAAVQAGVISQADSPFFRIAFREAEGRSAAQRAIRAAASRIRGGENLPVEDPETGALTPGPSATAILDEELAKYRDIPALQSRLGQAAFSDAVRSVAPALMESAQRNVDALELRRLQQDVGDELSVLALRTEGASDEELVEIGAQIDQQADVLRRAHVENYREVATDSLIRGLELMASNDPDRALLQLNTAIGELSIGGQKLDDNPRTAEMLAVERSRLRNLAEDRQRRQLKDQEITRVQQLRDQEAFIAKTRRDLAEAGVPATEVRRRILTQLENRIERGSQAVELAPNAEHLRLDALKFIDALLTDARRSDPASVDQIRQAITLARTEEELLVHEQAVRDLAGSALVGPELEGAMDLVRGRLAEVRAGFASSPVYSQAHQRLVRFRPPAGLPASAAGELDEELRADLAGFNSELRSSEAWANGQLDVEATERLTARFETRMAAKVQSAAARVEQTQADALTALLENASAAQIRREFSGRLDEEALRSWVFLAERRQGDIDGAVLSPRVQATTARVREAISGQLADAGVGLVGQAQAELALDVELRERALERLRGKPVDPTNVERTLIQVGSDLARERLKELAPSDPVAGGDVLGLAEGLEGDDVRQAVEREANFLSSAARGAAIARNDPEAIGLQLSASLGRAAVSDPALFADIQSAPYARGLFARNLSFTETRKRLRQRFATEIGQDRSAVGERYAALMAPVGIPIAEVVAGKVTIPANRFEGGEPVGLEEIEVKLPIAKIDPFTTPFFESEAEFRRFWNAESDELERLWRTWKISSPAAQQLWRDTQLDLARRHAAAAARNGR